MTNRAKGECGRSGRDGLNREVVLEVPFPGVCHFIVCRILTSERGWHSTMASTRPAITLRVHEAASLHSEVFQRL